MSSQQSLIENSDERGSALLISSGILLIVCTGVGNSSQQRDGSSPTSGSFLSLRVTRRDSWVDNRIVDNMGKGGE